MMISIHSGAPLGRAELIPVARLNCTFGAPVASANPTTSQGDRAEEGHLGTIDGTEHQVGCLGRAADIQIVQESPDPDVMHPAQILAKGERGDRGRTHQPFGAKNHRRRVRFAHIGRGLRADFVDAGRNAEMWHAARLGEAKRGEVIVAQQDSNGTYPLRAKPQVVGPQIECNTLGAAHLSRDGPRAAEVSSTDQDRHVRVSGAQESRRPAPDDTRTANEQNGVW